MSLYDVVSGNQTKAADLNQVVDLLNGTTQGTVSLNGGTTRGLNVLFNSAPGSEQSPMIIYINGDSFARLGFNIRTDGYGAITGGRGTSTSAYMYAQSDGLWHFTGGLCSDSNAVWHAGNLVVASSAPGSPSVGQLWVNTSINLG